MPPEALFQSDMFSGAIVDNRTAAQKKFDRDYQQPVQTEMFRQREIAQFGVRSRPQMSLSPMTKLVLVREDPRTAEQVEYDLLKEAEANTLKLFDNGSEGNAEEGTSLRVRSRGIMGYRRQQRQQIVLYHKSDVEGAGRDTNAIKQSA
jgi:hypothetical protein